MDIIIETYAEWNFIKFQFFIAKKKFCFHRCDSLVRVRLSVSWHLAHLWWKWRKSWFVNFCTYTTRISAAGIMDDLSVKTHNNASSNHMTAVDSWMIYDLWRMWMNFSVSAAPVTRKTVWMANLNWKKKEKKIKISPVHALQNNFLLLLWTIFVVSFFNFWERKTFFVLN